MKEVNSLSIILAWDAINKGNAKEALLLLGQELEKSPENKILLYSTGLAYRILNEYDQAERFYLKALDSKDESKILFPNLKKYSDLQPIPDVIYCQLGIIYQLKKQYEKAIEAFEMAIELYRSNIMAYNSLAITYRKKGDLEKSIEIYDRGIDIIFSAIYKKLHNSMENERIGFIGYKTEDKIWLKKALEVLLFFACKEHGIERLSWLTGEQTERYYSSTQYRSLLFIDYVEAKTRLMLPNYLDVFYKKLKSSRDYSLLLSNKARVFAELGKTSEARLLLLESVEFIPEEDDFEDPYIALKELEDK